LEKPPYDYTRVQECTPSAPLYNLSSQPSDLFLGSEWVLMEEEGIMGKCRGNSHKRATITWARRGCEMGRVSLFLSLDVK
jgi:hypothetical protein